MTNATLTISSKNYSSWSLRGWLLTKFSGLPFDDDIRKACAHISRSQALSRSISSAVMVGHLATPSVSSRPGGLQMEPEAVSPDASAVSPAAAAQGTSAPRLGRQRKPPELAARALEPSVASGR